MVAHQHFQEQERTGQFPEIGIPIRVGLSLADCPPTVPCFALFTEKAFIIPLVFCRKTFQVAFMVCLGIYQLPFSGNRGVFPFTFATVKRGDF